MSSPFVAAAMHVLSEMTKHDQRVGIDDFVLYHNTTRNRMTPMRVDDIYVLSQRIRTPQDAAAAIANIDAEDMTDAEKGSYKDETWSWADLERPTTNTWVKLYDPATKKTFLTPAKTVKPLPPFAGKSQREGYEWTLSEMIAGLYWYWRVYHPEAKQQMQQLQYTPTRDEIENGGPLRGGAVEAFDELEMGMIKPDEMFGFIRPNLRPALS